MKRIIFIITTIILLISMTFPTTVFAASIPTTTITSVKAQSKAFTVKWKKKSIKTKNAKTVSKKITKLKAAKKYYVRIRTYKGKKYSKWSKVKSIKTPKDTKSNKDNIQKETHCTNNNNHSIKCGNIGRWFNSRSDIETYWKNQCNALAEKWDKGEISDSEYYSKSPYGYECWSCSYCGKWTGNFKYR